MMTFSVGWDEFGKRDAKGQGQEYVYCQVVDDYVVRCFIEATLKHS